jgi:hypothetical protein
VGLEGGVGSLGGNGGEIMGCSDGGRGLKWRVRASRRPRCLLIANGHELSQKRWGAIGGRLMSAVVERSTAFVGSQ